MNKVLQWLSSIFLTPTQTKEVGIPFYSPKNADMFEFSDAELLAYSIFPYRGEMIEKHIQELHNRWLVLRNTALNNELDQYYSNRTRQSLDHNITLVEFENGMFLHCNLGNQQLELPINSIESIVIEKPGIAPQITYKRSGSIAEPWARYVSYPRIISEHGKIKIVGVSGKEYIIHCDYDETIPAYNKMLSIWKGKQINV